MAGRLALLAPILVPQIRGILHSTPPGELAEQMAPGLAAELGPDTAAAAVTLIALGRALLATAHGGTVRVSDDAA